MSTANSTQDIDRLLDSHDCRHLETFHFNLSDDGSGMISLYMCSNQQYIIRYYIEYNKIETKDFYYYKYKRHGLISIPSIKNNDKGEYIIRRIAYEIEKMYDRYIRELASETRDILIQINELRKKFNEARKRKIDEFSKELNSLNIEKFIENEFKIEATIISDKIEEKRIIQDQD